MRASRFTDSQILSIIKQNEAGISVDELCREHGMSSASFYKWRAKFGGMDASLMKRMKELEDENMRLRTFRGRSQNDSDPIVTLPSRDTVACYPQQSIRAQFHCLATWF